MVSFGDIGKGLVVGRQVASAADNFGLTDFTKSKKTDPEKTKFSVNNLLAQIQKTSMMPSSRFLVTLVFPEHTTILPSIAKKFNQDKMVQFLCHSTSLPGMSFTTSETRRYGVGPAVFYPSNVTYSELPLNFFVDGDAGMINFVQSWFNSVIHMGTKINLEQTKNGGATPYELSYRQDYVAEMIITLFSRGGDKVIEYILHEVTPSSLADISLDWGSTDEVMTLSSTFRFLSYEISTIEKASKPAASRGLSIFETITKAATVGQTIIGAIKNPQHVGDLLNLANNASLIKDNFNFTTRGG